MIDFFLKKQQTKLEILSQLSNEKKVSFSSFLSTLNLPRTTLKRAIDDLNSDLETNKLLCVLEQDESKKYYLVVSKNGSPLNIYHRLKLVYIKESLHFQLLNQLLTSNSQSIHDLTDHLVISSSYCYKLIKELNTLLAKFKLKISTLGKGGRIEITGQEQTLRIFSFIILTEIYQAIEWPFQHISKKEVESMIQSQKTDHTNFFSASKLNQVLFYLAITDLRVKNKKKLKSMNSELISVMGILTTNIDFLDSRILFSKYYHLDQTTVTNEVLYFNAIFRIVIAHSIPSVQKEMAGKKIVQSELRFSENLIKIANELFEEFNIQKNESTFFESVYFLSIYKIFMNLINIDIESLLKASYNYPISFEGTHYVKPDAIIDFCNAFLKKNPDFASKLFSKKNFYYTCIILNILTRIYRKTTLKIYIQFSKIFLGERLLKQNIENTFNSSTLLITSDFEQADLIISDSMDAITESKSKKYFYFYDVNDRRIWIELFQFIQLNLLKNIDSDYLPIWKEYFI